MKQFFITLSQITLTSLILMTAQAHADPQDTAQAWKEISALHGITIYSREIEGSPIVSFKGEGIIDAPIAKVVTILSDSSHKTEWVDQLVESHKIQQLNKLTRIDYDHTAVPWPFLDRDFVYSATATLNKETRTVNIQIQSVEDPAMPEQDGKVRGRLENSSFTLTSVNHGTATFAVVQITANPMGAIPKWIVNAFQEQWPRKTIEGIRTQVNKDYVTENAEIKSFFAENILPANFRGPKNLDPPKAGPKTAKNGNP